jgi:hypothetical protein
MFLHSVPIPSPSHRKHGAARLALPVTAFLPDLETTLARFGEEIIKPYANA